LNHIVDPEAVSCVRTVNCARLLAGVAAADAVVVVVVDCSVTLRLRVFEADEVGEEEEMVEYLVTIRVCI
jgi:hypothetical protein